MIQYVISRPNHRDTCVMFQPGTKEKEMSELKKFDLGKLRSDEIGHFAVQVNDILKATLGAGSKVSDVFMKAADAYLEAINTGASDSLSLAEADSNADRAWSAFYYQLQASTRCIDNDMRRAAEVVKAVFDQTDNPTALNYAAEYGALRILLERLEAIPAETHKLARTDIVLSDLRKTYDEFMALSNVVTQEASCRVYGVRKEKRTQLINEWKKLCMRLPALVDLNDDPKAAGAIERLNVIIDSSKSLIRQRTKGGKDNAAPEA